MNKVHPIVNLPRYIREDKDVKKCKLCLRYIFILFICVIIILIITNITIYIHNRINDDSSNQYRILHEIECSEFYHSF